MKKRILGMLLSVLIGGSLAGGFVACGGGSESNVSSSSENSNSGSGGSGEAQRPTDIVAKPISAELLDGKIANFMEAQGLGILDKNSLQTAALTNDNVAELSPIGIFGATARNGGTQGDRAVQKKNELVKTTESGNRDVYFYEGSENINDYGDLNNQFQRHHHKGEHCSIVACDKSSDELEAKEQSGEVKTIVSLGARISKLYNYGDWTFFTISSAVEGEVEINTTMSIMGTERINVGGEMVLVNMGDAVAAHETGISFIYLKDGAIPIKRIENDKYFHTGNYWSDAYNQSYVIDNNTGKTYSLAQFPRIYSVESGIIKVYNENANGGFDYYQPTIKDESLAYQKIELPNANETSIPVKYDGNIVKTDMYGNHVIESKIVIDDNVDKTYDANGEKKIGNNMIVSVLPASVQTEIRNQNMGNRMGQLFVRRYTTAKRYHLGSDGRIYRLNFKGNLSEISLSVLNADCEWQDVENEATATFEGSEGFVLWNYSEQVMIRDYFCLTKVEGGYAYYSSAAATDGGKVWDSHWMDKSTLNDGEYCGVVKIPVGGAETGESVRYAHLEEFAQYIAQFDFAGSNKAFLIGDTQVLYVLGNQSGEGDMLLKDVATGEIKELGKGRILPDENEYSIMIEGKGWLSLKEEIDLANFDSSEVFTDEPKDYSGGLDAYFLLISEQI